MASDPYFKKVVTLKLHGLELRLRVSQELFSSHQVDTGTRLLIRSIVDLPVSRFGRVLDFGCGYGPIGLALRALGRADSVELVDRDALAIEFARDNAALNRLDGVECYASLGFDDVRSRGFGLVAMNVPAAAGEPVIDHLLRQAGAFLAHDGTLALVAVARIADSVRGMLTSAPGLEIVLDWPHRSYTVLHCRSAAPVRDQRGFDGGCYDRAAADVEVATRRLVLRTVFGLPDFERESPAQRLLIDTLSQIPADAARRVACFNVGQGYVPLAAGALLRPLAVDLMDRDLLALRATARNLELMGYPRERVRLAHCVGMKTGAGQYDLIAGGLPDEGPEAIAVLVENAARGLSVGGWLMLAGGSTAVTRVEMLVRAGRLLAVDHRARKHGASALVLRRL